MAEKKQSIRTETIRRVLHDLAGYKKWLILTLLLAVVTVALTLYVPILTGRAIDRIESAGNVDFSAVTRILLTIGISVAVTALAQWIMSIAHNKITYEVIEDIRNRAIDRIEHLPLSYLDSHPTGVTVSRMISDVDQFADGLLMGFTQLFTGIVTIVGTLLFMFSMNVTIALIVVVLTPLSLFVARFIAQHTYEMFKLQSAQRGEQTALTDEVLTNEKTVKSYGLEEKMLARFDEINEELAHSSLKALFFSSLTNPSTRFVNNIIYALVACVGAIAVFSESSALFGSLSIGILTAFLSYANQYMRPFNEITSVITELQNAIACAARIFAVIEEESHEAQTEAPLEMPEVRGNISLSHIDFSYTGERKLFRDLNVSVKSGMKVAIVGPTGCGKTTLINLLMRFYEPDAGKILIDDTDAFAYRLQDVRKAFGMVLQDTWLFDGTVRENILFGKPDATEGEMIAAAKESHAHSFIRRLKDGYDTVIGEDGSLLSQGQKQLLCITRLMLNKPPMLILDEATSSIDTRTEIRIQNAFHKLMDGRTAFIVAHRLSTIRDADLILVMKDGTIVEQGTHESLLMQNGFYAELYSLA